jgi:hypothetical protein
MAMRIGVLGRGQVHGLAAALRALLPEADVVHFETAPTLDADAAEAVLAHCDHVVAHALPASWGKLAARSLAAHVTRLHVLPEVNFAGFHPDSIAIEAGGKRLQGPTGTLHSRIAVLGYLGDLSETQTVSLYNRLVFARLGYLRAYAEQSARLGARFAAARIELAPLLAGWAARGCFMHAPDRPKIRVLLDLARTACAMMGVEPAPKLAAAIALPDVLSGGETHPLLPDIAAAAGVAPEGIFRAAGAPGKGGRALSAGEFVSLSFRCFDGTDAAVLRAADGVAAGLASLRLAALRTRRAPGVRRGKERGMGLLSYHGTVLRQGVAGGLPRHMALDVTLQDRPALILEFPRTPQLHGFDSQALGGVQVVPGFAEGTVALKRQDRVLCPERDDDSAGFTRQRVGAWEALLPVRAADLAALFLLAAHDWRIEATGEPVPRASVRLAPDYVLWFGPWRIDLRQDVPTAEPPAADGRTRVALVLGGNRVVVVAVPAAAPAVPVAAPAALAVGQRRVVAGAQTLLCLPMVGSSADRRWLYDAYDGQGPVPAGWISPTANLCRAAGVGLRFDREGGAHPVVDTVPQAMIAGPAVLALAPLLAPRIGWIEASLRLFALRPFMPAGAFVLVPPEGLPAGWALAWQELGMARAHQAAPVGAFRVDDLTWLAQDSAVTLPAETLIGFRDNAQRAAGPGAPRRLFVHGLGAAVSPALLSAMRARGLEPVDLGGMSPVAQLAAFASADRVVGHTGPDLAGLVFCRAGTRVIELAAVARFDPAAWMVAAKIGLNMAILPCADEVDCDRFEALATMLENRD